MFIDNDIPNASSQEELELFNFEEYENLDIKILELSTENEISYGRYAEPYEGEIILKDGSIYKGSIIKNRAQGKGTLFHNNGTCYSGQFEGGILKGMVDIQYTNGIKYRGRWLRERPFGLGQFTYPDGVIFKAIFDQSGYPSIANHMVDCLHKQLPSGYYYQDSDNIKYFNLYCPTQLCRVETEDGLIYTGTLSKRLKMNGQGKLINA